MDSADRGYQLHPAIIKLGGLYTKGLIQHDDDRVHSLVEAFISFITDYKTPPCKILREDLDRYVKKQVQFIVDCRQLSRGMGNFIKHIRSKISKIPPEMSESDAKSSLILTIETFLEEKIAFAGENIAKYVDSIIRNNEVILTYGTSPLIRKILLVIAKSKKFRLIVVDSRPLNDGLQTLATLSQVTHCIYSPLCGAAAAMQEATKVLLGASALLSNGFMLAQAGSALISSLAKNRQIPVIIAAESYKFSDKVQLDSIVYNELGSPNEICSFSGYAAAINLSLSSVPMKGSQSSVVPLKNSGRTTFPESSSTNVSNSVQSHSSVKASSSSSTTTEGSGTVGTGSLAPQYQSGYRGGTAMDSNTSIFGGNSTIDAPVGEASHSQSPIIVPVGWQERALQVSSTVVKGASAGNTKGPITTTPSSGSVALPFKVTNLRYDLTPVANISVVASEFGLLPPTSIPILIREIQISEDNGNSRQRFKAELN